MPRQSQKRRSGGSTHKGRPTGNEKSKAVIKDAKYVEDNEELDERDRIRQEHFSEMDEMEQDATTHPNRNRNKPKIDKHTRG